MPQTRNQSQNPIIMTTPNVTNTANATNATAKYPIQFVSTLINCSFNGNPVDLPPLLQSCNSAFTLIKDDNKVALLYYIINQINGKALQLILNKFFNSWDELKNCLK